MPVANGEAFFSTALWHWLVAYAHVGTLVKLRSHTESTRAADTGQGLVEEKGFVGDWRE